MKSSSLAVGVCVAFLNSLKDLPACSCCRTIRCIVLVPLCCKPERTDKDEKSFFLLLVIFHLNLLYVLCQQRVEQTAVALVAWGEECLGDGRRPERWCSEAAYGGLSNNCCQWETAAVLRTWPLTDWLFECSPHTNRFLCEVGLILTLFERFCDITSATATGVWLYLLL